jgi:hypothetical protein
VLFYTDFIPNFWRHRYNEQILGRKLSNSRGKVAEYLVIILALKGDLGGDGGEGEKFVSYGIS